MNTLDFKPFDIEWPEIITKQRQLMFEFEPGLKTANFDIETLEDQETFKRFAWRITEELMEAIEASDHLMSPEAPGKTREHLMHLQEELMDAFNFYIELMDLARIPIDFSVMGNGGNMYLSVLQDIIGETIFHLGMASNRLKNRGWRQTQYLVDMIPFRQHMTKVAWGFANMFATAGLKSDKDIRDLWSLKYQVNKFRLQSKY